MKVVLCLIALCTASLAVAQTKQPDQRIRLAQNYERAGKLEEALRIYQDLYAEDPDNFVYFDGLSRTYTQLKRHDEAIQLVRARLTHYPADLALRAKLGSLLYKSGDEQGALAEWNRAIAADSLNPSVYKAVAAAMVENRLLDRTADLYRRAREVVGRADLFTIELAQLFSATMNFRGATAEYARWLVANPGQLSFVQQRMAGMAGREEGRAEAITELESDPETDDSLPLQELLAWLYLEGKDYGEAHRVYRRIDELAGGDGARIYQFADQAYREGAFVEASRAYREAIAVPVAPNRLPAARYGYALCLKEIAVREDSLRGMSLDAGDRMALYDDARTEFEGVIREFPGTEYAARAYFQVGLLLYERFFDREGALRALDAVERMLPPTGPVTSAVSLKMGEVMTASGDTAGAAVRFRTIRDAASALPDQQDEATFRLAELLFFRGEFEEASAMLGGLTLNLRADYANDALRLQAFLNDNMASWRDALVTFARAAYLERRHDDAGAVPLLNTVVGQYPKAPLVDEALMLEGQLLTRAGRYQEAIEAYRRLATEFTGTSIAPDQAWFAIGEVYQYRLQDSTAASGAYETLLTEYPESLHADEARRRIRSLRGESL